MSLCVYLPNSVSPIRILDKQPGLNGLKSIDFGRTPGESLDVLQERSQFRMVVHMQTGEY